MLALGYVIVSIVLFGAFALAVGACVGAWFGIRAFRPELLEKR